LCKTLVRAGPTASIPSLDAWSRTVLKHYSERCSEKGNHAAGRVAEFVKLENIPALFFEDKMSDVV
jgi:hypothetical protein